MKAEPAKKPNPMGREMTERSPPARIIKKIQVQLILKQ